MKILFLSRWFPYPPNNGSKLRIYQLLKGLSHSHETHLLSFCDDPIIDTAAAHEKRLLSIRTVQWREFNPSSRRAALGFFSLTPRSLVDTYSPQMEQEIRCALQEQHFDLIITSQWQMTAYRHFFSNVPVLMEEIEVGTLHGQLANSDNLQTRLRSQLTWLKHKHYLARVLGNNQPCTVVSEQEKELLAGIVPDNQSIYVIPNGAVLDEAKSFQELPEPGRLIFTGSFRFRPNYEAMVWFLERVFPLVRAQVPGASLTITGDNAGLPLPHSEGVTLTGYVEDVRPLIKQAWASIVPLHVGGGTRLKILEAMALFTPVISTSKGAEGLVLTDGINVEIADTAEEFAARTIRVLQDEVLRDRLAENAFSLVLSTYDWNVIIPKFLSVVANAPRATR